MDISVANAMRRLMAWWDRSTDRSGDQPEKPAPRDRARGIFEDRFREWPTGPGQMVVQQGAGRIIGYEIDGEFGRPAVLQQPSRMPAQRVLDAIRRVYDLHGDDDAAL